MSLTLKIISAVGQATLPGLSFEIIGAIGLLSVGIQRIASLRSQQRDSV